MTTRVRVLHLIWSLDLGGAERQVLELVRGMDRTRFEPVVGCLVRKGRWGHQLESEGVRVEDFGKRPGLDIRTIARLARFIRKERIDLVHTHAFTAATTGRLAALLAGRPRVVAHEHSHFSLPSWLHRSIDRALVMTTDRFVAVSLNLARDLIDGIGLPQHAVAIVPNGIRADRHQVDTRAAAVLRSGFLTPGVTRIAGCVGRLEPRKGLDTFLEAIAQLVPSHPFLGAVLVGEGPSADALRRQARELGIADRVVFTGRREDIPAVLAAIDVYVLPSRSEGLSISLLEAAAAAKPIVATDVGGNTEVIVDGSNGLVVPAGEPAFLVDAIRRLLAGPQQAAALGRRAAAVAGRNFSAERMVRAVEDVYDDVLRRGSALDGGFKRAPALRGVKAVARTALARGVSLLRSARQRCGARILTYHRVNDSHPGDRLSVHPVAFLRQMESLRVTGKRVVPLSEIVRALRSDVAVADGTLAITFDDGYQDTFDFAWPILQRFGLVATFFLPTDLIGTSRSIARYEGCCSRDGCFGWDEAREMLTQGQGLGGHGRSHAELATLDEVTARAEIEGARDDLARETGERPLAFCYPRGSESPAVRQLVADAGFEAACSIYPGVNDVGDDLFVLRRTEVSGFDSLADFRLKLSGAYDSLHSVRQAASLSTRSLRSSSSSAAS